MLVLHAEPPTQRVEWNQLPRSCAIRIRKEVIPQRKMEKQLSKGAWMLGRHGGGMEEVSTKQGYVEHGKELGFYAKSTGMPSKGFKQESNMLAFDLTTLPKDILTAE